MAGESIVDERSLLLWSDYVVIAVYFLFVLAIGIWTSTKNRGSVKGYFLAGQNQHWIPVGASIFASNIGSQHFLGLAGGGAANGLSVAYYEISAVMIVLILGWVFVPVYLASGSNTMPEYLRLRFGGRRIRIFLSGFSLLAYIFTKISIDIYAGYVFIEQATRLNTYVAIAAIVTMAALFTITGGLTAVIWTDFVQTILMVAGAVLLLVQSFVAIGGYSKLVYGYHGGIPESLILSNSTCNMPPEDAFHIFKDPLSTDLPWPGALTGAVLKSLWYWCADQVIVQRALAAKNITHAKAGTVLAGALKMLPLFLLVLPGMAARILYPETVGCADAETCSRVCGSPAGCTNIAYPSLVLNLMPTGIRGLMLAVMLAALMSSLTSVFNSSSTIFTLDIWVMFRKKATNRELMVVGRVFVIILVALGVLWVELLQGSHGSQIFTYSVQVGSFFQPPVIAAFTLALFVPRVNEQGAFWSMIIGAAIGIGRFALEYSYEIPSCGEGLDTRPSFIKDVHFLYFALMLYILCLLIAVVISILSKPISPHHLHRLTFWNRFDKEKRVDLPTGEKIDESESLLDERAIQTHDSDKVEDEENEMDHPIPVYRRAILWLCGIDHKVTNDRVDQSQQHERMNHQLLYEKRSHAVLVNVFAVVLTTLAVSVTVFYK
ncbi:sodium/glucose cotransporter 4-like [Watersipora subatra]|uniref:sodium/glucose cotransporter 4-like n=1 Tax=Watersipora subatra TaxID=2589382 RepID=UPI00355C7847